MSAQRDGGPAFPGKTSPLASDAKRLREELGIGLYDAKELLSYSGGMTLRDYAAIHADVDGIEFPNWKAAAAYVDEDEPDAKDFPALLALSARLKAKLSYMYADAMLAAREVRVPPPPPRPARNQGRGAVVIEDTSTYRVPTIPQPTVVFVDYVFGDDWCGLYANGELVMEGHSMNALDVLEWIRDEDVAIGSIATMQADDDWLSERGDLPKHIRDVKAKECGHGNHD